MPDFPIFYQEQTFVMQWILLPPEETATLKSQLKCWFPLKTYRVVSVSHHWLRYKQFPRTNFQHRISAAGWLLFMRCVSFTFNRLLPTWTPTEIFDSFWVKHFSDCDSIICPIKSKLRFLKVFKILKRTWHFQTDWILCVINCSGCSHVVSDAGSMCSCC